MLGGGAAGLFIGLLLSAVGVGYVAYGKRTAELHWLVAGFALLLFPLFIGSTGWLVAIGAALVVTPWLGQRMGWW